MLFVILILAVAPLPSFGQAGASSAARGKLAVSLGRWVFHGQQLHTRSGRPIPWTWKENCRWSSNQLYLECTFSNVWGGRKVESLVVDTWNEADHAFWHYELYAGGEHGAHPYVSHLAIAGNTWIEQAPTAPGQTARERIVYQWSPPNRVGVVIEDSRDGVHWTAVDRGEGRKLP